VSRQRVYVGRGLTHKMAWKLARQKVKGDFRGMKYDAVTGWATLV
jgi:hypothetical protein